MSKRNGLAVGKTVFILNEKVTEQDQTKQHAISFLAERMTDTSKSGTRKATAKQFNYSRSQIGSKKVSINRA
jgi:hypothetical protein